MSKRACAGSIVGSMCWSSAKRNSKCGGPSSNGMCHRGRRGGPPSKKNSACWGPSDTRNREKGSMWWAHWARRATLLPPHRASPDPPHAVLLAQWTHVVLRVHGPTTRCSACSMDTTHAALLDGPTTSCSRLLNGPMDHRTLLQEEHVLGSIGPRAVCAGVHRGRRTACAGSTAQEEHQQGVRWVHQARRTGVGSIKVAGGGGVRGEVWGGGTGRPSGRGLATDCVEWGMGTKPIVAPKVYEIISPKLHVAGVNGSRDQPGSRGLGEQRRFVWSLMDLGAQRGKGALARGKHGSPGPSITTGESGPRDWGAHD